MMTIITLQVDITSQLQTAGMASMKAAAIMASLGNQRGASQAGGATTHQANITSTSLMERGGSLAQRGASPGTHTTMMTTSMVIVVTRTMNGNQQVGGSP